jgi:hypothetical protein
MKFININAALNLIIAGTIAAFSTACTISAEPQVIIVTATPQPTPVVVTTPPEPTLLIQLAVEPTTEVETKPAPVPD